MNITTSLQRAISVAFAMGNMESVEPHLSDDIRWNILGEEPIIGKVQVLEVYKMIELESFPVITIKNIVSAGDYVVVESNGVATTKEGKPYNQAYCDVFRFSNSKLVEITTYLDTAVSKEAFGDH